MADFSEINKELNRIAKFVDTKAKEVIGSEAVKYYRNSFEKQSFDGKPWKDVKRRDSSSSWYGFQYGAKQKKPANHPSRKRTKRPYKARKSNPITNFAKVATKTDILSSQRSELENSIGYKIQGKSIVIFSDKPYAKVQNEGGLISVFGKRTVKLSKRQFIGYSSQLEKIILHKLSQKFKNL